MRTTCFAIFVLLSVLGFGQNHIASWAYQQTCIDSSEYGDLGISMAVASIVDKAGYQYVLFNYEGDMEVFNGDTVHYPSATQYNGNGGCILRKLDPFGSVVWSKQMVVDPYYAWGPDTVGIDVQAQAISWHYDSTILFAIDSKKRGTLWYSDSIKLNNIGVNADTTYSGLFLVNIDENGDLIWKQRFMHRRNSSTPKYDLTNVSQLKSTASGDILFAGRTTDYIGVGDSTFYAAQCSGCQVPFSWSGFPFAAKLNSLGEVIWLNHAKYTGSLTFGSTIHYHRQMRPDWYAHRATSDNDGNIFLSFISDVMDSSWVSFDDDTIFFAEEGQHYFLTKLNGQTGQCEWIKNYRGEWTAQGSTLNDPGLCGPLVVHDSVIYNFIYPFFKRMISFTIDSGPTLNDPDPMGVFGYNIRHNLDGDYIGHDSLTATTNSVTDEGGHALQAQAVYNDALYFLARWVNVLTVNGSTFNAFSSSSMPTMMIKYDLQSNQYSLERTLIADNYSFEDENKSLTFSSTGDYFISGDFSLAMDFGEVELNGYEDEGYHVKYTNCDYLSLPISGDSVICEGESTSLSVESIDSVSYTWKYNGFAVTGQTTSTLNTNQGGTYEVVVSDTLGCEATSPVYVVSAQEAGSISFDLPSASICENDSALVLSGGQPTGGNYFGSGVSGSYFNPSNVPLGSNTLYYTALDSLGCIDTVSDNIYVYAQPTVFFFQTINACDNDTVTLNGGLPSGGIYSGLGVNSNQFLAQSAGTGSHNLVYTYTNSSGCSNTDTITAVVNPSPNVAFNWSVDSTCENASPIAINGFAPSGGTFSGTGVSGNYFIPGIVDPDEYVISYSVDSGGCTSVARDTIQVDSFPDVILEPLDSICLSATSYVLDHGYPAGGNYSGTGITNNVFDASVAGIGTHTVRYIFENSCAADTAYSTITVIASPTATASATSVSCSGLDDGSLTASISGGNGPYSFQWSNGDSAANATNLTAGSYTLTATGEGGCLVFATFGVTEPDPLVLSLDSSLNVNCNGFNDGEAFVSTAGGVSTYSYLWSNGSTTEDISSLSANIYTLTATDANGCEDSLVVTIDQDNPIVLFSSKTDISCNGAMDGTGSTTASGGGGTYNYAWSNGSTSSSTTNLDQGEAYITVTDQNNCEAIDTIDIIEPDSLLVTLSSVDIDCFGDDDGIASSTAMGGRAPYGYAWNIGGTGSSLSSLTAGTYTLTVTDSSNCTSTDSIIVSQPDSISIDAQIQDILCHGDSNGAISVSASGGIGILDFIWNTGSTSDSIGGLHATTYTVSVTDDLGCTNEKSISLDDPALLTVDISIQSPKLCFNDSSASLLATPAGGTGSVGYNWNTGHTTDSITNLIAGTYTVTVTDSVGCIAIDSFEINDPDELALDITTTNVLCFGDSSGTAIVNVTNNNGPVTFNWSSGSTTASESNLWASVFEIIVTDSTGCSAEDYAFISEPTALDMSIVVDSILCLGDSNGIVEAQPTGGTVPYAYNWTNGATQAVNDSLYAGNYAVTVTDSNGCQMADSVTLVNPDPIQITSLVTTNLDCFGDSNGLASIVATTGNDSVFFLWNDGDTSDTRSDLMATTYTVTAADENGCAIDSSFTLSSPSEIIVQLDSIQHLPCFGDSSGLLYTSSFGGVGTLNGIWNTGQTADSINQLVADLYIRTTTDDNGCVVSDSFSIDQPDAIAINDSIINTLCSNDESGAIYTETNGGTGGIDYLWSNGSTTQSLVNLLPGLYFLTLKDQNQCERTDSFTINFDFLAPVASLGADTGLCDGDTLKLMTTGTSDVYTWSSGASTPSILVSAAGSYWVQLDDSTGCSDRDTIAIEVFPLPIFDLGDDIFICDDSLASGIMLTGPSGMISYSWSDGTTAQSTMVNTIGNYFLEVEDANGCAYLDNVFVIDDTCLGISPVLADIGLSIYPNPNHGSFTIESESEKDLDITILNAHGALVQKSTMNRSMQFTLLSDDQGVYFIHISDGQRLWVERIVVMR